ncbi:MAG: Yip1 family protein [Xanthobacteraceae bacterium]
MNAALRAFGVLVDPPGEWAKIAEEPDDPALLMIRYTALLAIIPAVCGFLGACVIGSIVPGAGAVRAPFFYSALGTVFGYLECLALVVLLALIVNIGAPLFTGRRNFAGALKVAAYAFTPLWLAGIFLLLPGLRFLMLTGFYGVYILAAGLPRMMNAPAGKTPGFTALVVVLVCALIFIAASAEHALFGIPLP